MSDRLDTRDGRYIRWRPALVERNRGILRMRANGVSAQEIADRYGLTAAQIYNICGSNEDRRRGRFLPVDYTIVTKAQKAYGLQDVNKSRTWEEIADLLGYESAQRAYDVAREWARSNKRPAPSRRELKD